ncbi:MAG: hypothetical protein M1831_005427 [Alyxoria varia]|nr:MAG: hypothetical protein M1831_005427 [Alyxoria varia]
MVVPRILDLGYVLILQACFSRQALGLELPSSGLSFRSRPEQEVAEIHIEAKHDEGVDAEVANLDDRPPRDQSFISKRKKRHRRDAPGIVLNPKSMSSKDGDHLQYLNFTHHPPKLIPEVSLPVDAANFEYNGTKWTFVNTDCSILSCTWKSIAPPRSQSRKIKPFAKRDSTDETGKEPDEEERFDREQSGQEHSGPTEPEQEDDVAKFRLPPLGPLEGPQALWGVMQPPWADLWRTFAKHMQGEFSYYFARKDNVGQPGPTLFRWLRWGNQHWASLPPEILSEISNRLPIDLHMLLSPAMLHHLVYNLRVGVDEDRNFGDPIWQGLVEVRDNIHQVLGNADNLVDGDSRLPVEVHIPRPYQGIEPRSRSGHIPPGEEGPPLNLDPEQHGPQPNFDNYGWYHNWLAQFHDIQSEAFRLQAQRLARDYDWSQMTLMEAISIQAVMEGRLKEFENVLHSMARVVESFSTAAEVAFENVVVANRYALLVLDLATHDLNTNFHPPWPWDHYTSSTRREQERSPSERADSVRPRLSPMMSPNSRLEPHTSTTMQGPSLPLRREDPSSEDEGDQPPRRRQRIEGPAEAVFQQTQPP